MPHRPADSRLLSNLLSHEKDYVRSLHSQLDHGQSSLSSFSAYAAASPPPASRAIGSVATALVGAHDALRNYVLAVEEWCERLKMLKEMEDEVETIARDREILVDRLIKASKSNNPKRRSLLPSKGGSSHNVSSMSTSNSTLEQLSFSNSKLNLAQNELQACETHLTEKERMLVQMRENALVGGLKSRCKALVECGWKWAEVGKSGLKALDSSVSGGSPDRNGLHLHKPLPDIHSPYNRPSSDLSSSIAPSQSASQIFHTDVTSEQYHPSSGSSSIPTAHGPAPEADIRDGSHFSLNIPPAHAISEEDHYTPPQMRAPPEEELDGSSAEEELDERQLEVHENPLFSQQPASNANSKRLGSKSRPSVKKPKRMNSDSAAFMPSSVSAPLPISSPSKVTFKQQSNDPFGTASSTNTYSDSQSDSRRRKRSTFLGLGALTGLFHKRERTMSMSGLPSSTSLSSQIPPSPTKKGGHWLTRTDKNLKKAGKDGDSSDEEVERPAPPISPLPSFITQSAQPARASGEESPKRARPNGKKLRKVSDGGTQRKASATDTSNSLKVNTGVKRAGSQKGQTISLNGDLPRSQSIGNGHTLSPLPATVSRSSTVRSQSTVNSSSSARPASLDLPSSGRGRNPGVSSDVGRPSATNKAHRRRTSVGSATSPPTRGQASLLSIVEGVARQNRQGWQQSNPNNLLLEIKAPKSIVFTESEGFSSSPTRMNGSDTPFTRSDSRRESPLRSPVVNGYRNGIPSSSSEPSLPLKKLPATPGPKAPLRSALRNRTPSPNPAAMSTPRSMSPARGAETISPIGTVNPLTPVLERRSTENSSVKDADSVSLSSAYETGQEDLEDEPPTPRPEANGFAIEPKSNESQLSASASSTGGTATPPSRRKSVRVSLKPTFSPTPPAFADDDDDHSPWGPSSASTKGQTGENGWASRISENTGWEDSSDEDEDYARARQMLQKATRKLEKASKGE